MDAWKSRGIVTTLVLIVLASEPSAATSRRALIDSAERKVIVQGAGASFPQHLYTNAILAYELNSDDAQVRYFSTGSGLGMDEIRDFPTKAAPNDVHLRIDFAGTDSELSEEDYARHPDLVMYPAVGGAIVPIYNLPGIVEERHGSSTLRLTKSLLARIFRSNVTKWSDAEILALNPSLSSTLRMAGDIRVIVRGDSSGSTEIFKGALSKFDVEFEEEIGRSRDDYWGRKNFTRRNQNAGVASMVLATPGSIGYSIWAEALNIGLSVADLCEDEECSNVIRVSTVGVKAAMHERGLRFDVAPKLDPPLLSSAGGLLTGLLTADITGARCDGSWPITGFTYFVLRTRTLRPGATCENREATVRFFDWFYNSDSVAEMAGRLGFVPLTMELKTRVLKWLHNNITYCLDDKGISVEPFSEAVPVRVMMESASLALVLRPYAEFYESVVPGVDVLLHSHVNTTSGSALYFLSANDFDSMARSVQSNTVGLPWAGVAAATVYNLCGGREGCTAPSLILDVETIHAIFARRVTTWDDSAILRLNPEIRIGDKVSLREVQARMPITIVGMHDFAEERRWASSFWNEYASDGRNPFFTPDLRASTHERVRSLVRVTEGALSLIPLIGNVELPIKLAAIRRHPVKSRDNIDSEAILPSSESLLRCVGPENYDGHSHRFDLSFSTDPGCKCSNWLQTLSRHLLSHIQSGHRKPRMESGCVTKLCDVHIAGYPIAETIYAISHRMHTVADCRAGFVNRVQIVPVAVRPHYSSTPTISKCTESGNDDIVSMSRAVASARFLEWFYMKEIDGPMRRLQIAPLLSIDVVAKRNRAELDKISCPHDGSSPSSSILRPYEEKNYLADWRRLVVGMQNVAAIALLLCLFLFFWARTYRDVSIVRLSSPTFLYSTCLGCAITVSTIFPLSIDDSRNSAAAASVACQTAPWLFSLGFTLTYSSLLVKAWRLHLLFNVGRASKSYSASPSALSRGVGGGGKRLSSTELGDRRLVAYVLLLQVPVVLINAVWTIRDPLIFVRTTTRVNEAGLPLSSEGACASSDRAGDGGNDAGAYIWTLTVYLAVLMLTALRFSYMLRKQRDTFAESKWVLLSMATNFETLAMGLPILHIIYFEKSASYRNATFYATACIVVLLTSVGTIVFLFAPKIYHTHFSREARNRRRHPSNGGNERSEKSKQLTKHDLYKRSSQESSRISFRNKMRLLYAQGGRFASYSSSVSRRRSASDKASPALSYKADTAEMEQNTGNSVVELVDSVLSSRPREKSRSMSDEQVSSHDLEAEAIEGTHDGGTELLESIDGPDRRAQPDSSLAEEMSKSESIATVGGSGSEIKAAEANDAKGFYATLSLETACGTGKKSGSRTENVAETMSGSRHSRQQRRPTFASAWFY